MLKPSEKASLAQVQKILNQYDICFIAPIKLRKTIIDSGFKAEFWPDSCFASVYSYSHLLLTEEFYRRFTAYEYMLIYQLDAFVFSNRLQEFCDLGFDYIGAPLPYLKTKYNVRIGNGGFSLRKISSCISVVAKKEEIYDKTGKGELFEYGEEDRFFGYCGWDKDIDFSVPDIKTALKFSIEYDIMDAYKKLSKGNLPFGCHAWSKPHLWKVWEPFIKKYIPGWIEVVDKELSKFEAISYGDYRRKCLEHYLVGRLSREKKKIYNEIMEKIIPASTDYVLWGKGKIGKEALGLLNTYSRDIKCIIDMKPDIQNLNGIKVESPEEVLSDRTQCKIIVSVIKPGYVAEIKTYLNSAGLKIKDDYVLYSDVIDAISKLYWDASVSRWGHGVGKMIVQENDRIRCIK